MDCALCKRCSSFHTSVRSPPRVSASTVLHLQVAVLRPNCIWGTQASIHAHTGSPNRVPAPSDPRPSANVCIYSSRNGYPRARCTQLRLLALLRVMLLYGRVHGNKYSKQIKVENKKGTKLTRVSQSINEQCTYLRVANKGVRTTTRTGYSSPCVTANI